MNHLERRISARQPPNYGPAELADLRIAQVHFRQDYLFCLLSDGNMLCVPLTISSVLLAAPQQVRYQWKIADDGTAVLWCTKGMGVMTERLALENILAHPDARISTLRG
jgi:hypothetical protein